jgi:hypothetical protein
MIYIPCFIVSILTLLINCCAFQKIIQCYLLLWQFVIRLTNYKISFFVIGIKLKAFLEKCDCLIKFFLDIANLSQLIICFLYLVEAGIVFYDRQTILPLFLWSFLPWFIFDYNLALLKHSIWYLWNFIKFSINLQIKC